MATAKKAPNMRKSKGLRLMIEPALREKLDVLAAKQRRSVPNLAEFYIAMGAEREYAEEVR
jgi:hypothetical protein